MEMFIVVGIEHMNRQRRWISDSDFDITELITNHFRCVVNEELTEFTDTKPKIAVNSEAGSVPKQVLVIRIFFRGMEYLKSQCSPNGAPSAILEPVVEMGFWLHQRVGLEMQRNSEDWITHHFPLYIFFVDGECSLYLTSTREIVDL